MKLILHVLIFFILSISSSLQAQILKDCRLPNSVPNRPGEHDDNGKMHMRDFIGDGFQDDDKDLVLLKPSNNNAYPATLFLNNGSGEFNDSIDLPVSITA